MLIDLLNPAQLEPNMTKRLKVMQSGHSITLFQSRDGSGWFLYWTGSNRCAGAEIKHATEEAARAHAALRFPGVVVTKATGKTI